MQTAKNKGGVSCAESWARNPMYVYKKNESSHSDLFKTGRTKPHDSKHKRRHWLSYSFHRTLSLLLLLFFNSLLSLSGNSNFLSLLLLVLVLNWKLHESCLATVLGFYLFCLFWLRVSVVLGVLVSWNQDCPVPVWLWKLKSWVFIRNLIQSSDL